MASHGALPQLGSNAIAAGIAAGNINTPLPTEQREMMDLSDSSRVAQDSHAAMLVGLEIHRRSRFMTAPTNIEEVKQKLRELGKPITLFGEGPADRRDRLKAVLAEIEVRAQVQADGIEAATRAVSGEGRSAVSGPPMPVSILQAAVPVAAAGVDKAGAPFYTPALSALVEARKRIAVYSFEHAKRRLSAQAHAASSPAVAAAEDAHAIQVYRTFRRMRPLLSQVADERPLSCCALSSDGALLAVGAWSSVVRLWNPATGAQYAALKGHKERVVSIAWHPTSGLGLNGEAINPSTCGLCVTASADGTARVWSVPVGTIGDAARGAAEAHGLCGLHDTSRSRRHSTQHPTHAGASVGGDDIMSGAHVRVPVTAGRRAQVIAEVDALCTTGLTESAVLAGHSSRLSCIAFHPTGDYVGTTSYDKTWRLWDVRTGQQAASHTHTELLLQEGHAKETYPIAFHLDGALVATGDLSGLGRVWDLRSGKSVFMLRGHTKQMLALDWSPNGTVLASGSDDNTCVVWDLRQQRTLYTIPAHASLVSRVKFAPRSGEYLLTCSFDGTVKAWSGRDWSPLGLLSGHDGKVTGIDIFAADEAQVVSVGGFDRTFKTWAHELEF